MYEITTIGIKEPKPGTLYRVRFYETEEALEADRNRPTSQPPDPTSGIVMDVVLETEWTLNPPATCILPPTILPVLVEPSDETTCVYFDFEQIFDTASTLRY